MRHGALYGETTMISHQVLSVLDEAGSNPHHDNGPLIDQRGRLVLYDVSVNRTEYEYFLSTGYHNADKQRRDVLDGRFQGPGTCHVPLSDAGWPSGADAGAPARALNVATMANTASEMGYLFWAVVKHPVLVA